MTYVPARNTIMLSVALAYFIHMTGLDLAWCFLIVFALTVLVMEVIGFILSKVFSLPGLNIINGLAGAVIGLFIGAVFFGIILSLLLALDIPALSSAIEGSLVPYYLVNWVSWAYSALGYTLPDLKEAIPLFKGFGA